MTYKVENNILTVVLPERIDTSVSATVSVHLDRIVDSEPHDSLVLDASGLTFISSCGLRILLGLAKREKELKVTGVNAEVYNVFSMTGFTRIITVEQALREVSIEGSSILGKGGVGTVYRLTDETILKVFREGTPLSDVEREINLSREAFVYGLPTAISFELVRVGNQYGIIHELINARTLAQVITNDPTHVEEYGAMLGRIMKQIHAVHDVQGTLPDAVEETNHKIEVLRRYFTSEQIDLLHEIYDAVPHGNSILHCDLHPKNVMDSNGELILIDMGEVCHGHPLEDLSHTYSSMRGLVGDYEAILGMNEELAHRCFDSAIRAYLDIDDEALIARRVEQIRVVSLLRSVSWLALSDSFPEELINRCRLHLQKNICANMPYIREVLKQLKEWEVND